MCEMQNTGYGILSLASIGLSYKSSQGQRVFQKPIKLSKLQDRTKFGWALLFYSEKLGSVMSALSAAS